jgi:hypothetical protein
LKRETLSLGKQAFGAVPVEERAPGAGAPLPEGEINFWEAYIKGITGPSLALDTATQFQIYHKVFSDQLQDTYRRLAAGAVFHGPLCLSVAAPASVTVPAALSAIGLGVPLFGPPAAPILAVRNVRRALAENPTDPPAYELLANAIDTLQKRQEETWVGREPSFRQQMRQLQVITAWKSYLKLKPDDPRVHEQMFIIYITQLGYRDVALEHLRLAVSHWDRQPRPMEGPARQQFEERRKFLEQEYRNREKDVKDRQAAYDLRASGMPTTQKFNMAIGPRPGQGLGLARRALQALQQANLSPLDQRERLVVVFQQVSLLLLLGEIGKVNEALPDLKGFGPDYFRFEVFCAAAAGEYDRADAAIAEHLKLWAVEKRLALLMRDEIQQLVPAPIAVARLEDRQFAIASLLQQTAGWHLIRGILALERGDTELAERSFQKVVDFFYFPERHIAEQYLKLIRENHQRRLAATR